MTHAPRGLAFVLHDLRWKEEELAKVGLLYRFSEGKNEVGLENPRCLLDLITAHETNHLFMSIREGKLCQPPAQQ